MSDTLGAPTPPRPRYHPVDFRGTGGEFFRIWIVNLALTVVTLGIFSAWAKVRTRRYFYGNTFVAGHSFDYHANPVRILIGRAVALGLFVGYNVSAGISPLLMIPWLLLLGVAIPWLIVTSQRFNARNTSYRNVRFNFTGEYWGAFKAFLLWPLAGIATLGCLAPLAHRARDYFLINHRTFGGKPFKTTIDVWSIYGIYLIAALISIAAIIGLSVAIVIAVAIGGLAGLGGLAAAAPPQAGALLAGFAIGLIFLGAWTCVMTYIGTNVFNLAVSGTVLDDSYQLKSELSPWSLIGIAISNLLLMFLTLGLFYPWARVRIATYLADNMGLEAFGGLDEFTSEVFAAQSAVGEEIAGFFDFDIGV